MTELLGLGLKRTDVSVWGFVLITSLLGSECLSKEGHSAQEELLGVSVFNIPKSHETPAQPRTGCKTILDVGDTSSPPPVLTKAQQLSSK